MIKSIKERRYWAILLCIGIIIMAYSLLLNPLSSQNTVLTYGIAGDLLFTSPAIYWFITKKHSLKKPITLLLFVSGVFTFIKYAPPSYSETLKSILTVVGPLVEITIFGFVVYKFRGFLKTVDWKSGDVFLAVNEVTKRAFENKTVAAIVASEFCMFYYSFFTWKEKSPKTNEYTYHKTGSDTILWAIIGLILIESVAIHLLLMKWNSIVAYILLGLSLYTAVQIFAHIKAKSRRFIQFKESGLILKYGLSNYFEIPYDQIKSIEKDSLGSVDKEMSIAKFGLLEDLENHNLKLTFYESLAYDKLYGMKGVAKSLLLYIDNPNSFKEELGSRVKLQ